MLPYDYSRCKPELVDTYCKNCKRWADHPDKTWGERTPFNTAESSNDERCSYIPIVGEDK
jgi:hypothetical protein